MEIDNTFFGDPFPFVFSNVPELCGGVVLGQCNVKARKHGQ